MPVEKCILPLSKYKIGRTYYFVYNDELIEAECTCISTLLVRMKDKDGKVHNIGHNCHYCMVPVNSEKIAITRYNKQIDMITSELKLKLKAIKDQIDVFNAKKK